VSPTRRTARASWQAGALAVLVGSIVLGAPAPASAHPLGNATVNHYDGLTLTPRAITDTAVLDVAEIPTFQRRSQVDVDRDGRVTDVERERFADRTCAALAAGVNVVVDGRQVVMAVVSSGYSESTAALNLPAGRLECELRGDVDLTRPAKVEFSSSYDSAGIGWHEVTAVGAGVALENSPFPERSVSDELRAYPGNLLASPLDQRGGTLQVRPGAGSTYQLARDVPVAGPAVRALDHVAQTFNGVVGRDHLTLGVGLLGVLLALLLGAGHALLPGHGKTVMAAYLVGRRGRLRDVVTLGATVTMTHTAGVLVLGLLLTTGAALAPAQVEQVLGVVSGGLVVLEGLYLLASALRSRRTPRLAEALAPAPVARELVHVGASMPGAAEAHHEEHHVHVHDHHGHGGHRHGHGHGHSHASAGPGFGRAGLIGLGLAGGLVPSPSALIVLLAAGALGRTWFGVVLVLAYGIGMALALCVAGLLLLRLRSRLVRAANGRRVAWADRVLVVMPVITGVLVLVVGTGLVLRALSGSL
jgi:ABC-type nickel/cobalt efflux system permease component RcnA